MAATGTRPRPTPRRGKSNRLPGWLTLTLVALLEILVYGMVAPKAPSAFDRPEAQTNPVGNPWNAPRSF